MSLSVIARAGRGYLGVLPRAASRKLTFRSTPARYISAPGRSSILCAQIPADYHRGLLTSPLCRASYSTSTTAPSTSQKKEHRIFQDTHRPEVFYHLVDAPTPVSATDEAYAISLLDSLQTPQGNGGTNAIGSEGANSATVVGWVPSNAEGKPLWSVFRENRKFS